MLLGTGVATGVVAAELFSEKDVIGTWKIEPSTLTIRELAIPNSFPRPQLPTNHSAFALIFNEDKSFAATNVPAKLFFGWPAMLESTGTWWVRTDWPLLGPTNASNAYSRLDLWFERPPYGAFGRAVYRSGRSTSSAPAFVLGPYKDETHTYEWTVLVTKQK